MRDSPFDEGQNLSATDNYDIVTEGSFIHQNGIIVSATEEFASMVGVESPEELIGTKANDLLSETSKEIIQNYKRTYQGIYDIVVNDRNEKSYYTKINADDIIINGESYRLINVKILKNVDHYEELLHVPNKNSDHFRNLLDVVPFAVFITKNGIILYANEQARELYGYTKTEVIGNSISIFQPEELQPVSFDADLVRERGEANTPPVYETIGITKAGERIPVRVQVIGVEFIGVQTSVRIIEDLRVEKNLQLQKIQLDQKIAQTQRLESLGVLAGGVAHDFNNILMSMSGYISLLKINTRESDNNYSYLLQLEKSIRTAARLSDQILTYAGKHQDSGTSSSIREVIDDNIEFFRTSISKNIDLRIDLDDKLPLVDIDPNNLVQILENLMVNAAEAIGGDNGRIEIISRVEQIKVEAVQSILPVNSIEPGNYVCITVSDNGTGISAKDLTQIFDPFYSTKFTGRGLGLSVVLGILRSLGGGIRVVTGDNGSVFSVFLPIAEGQTIDLSDEESGSIGTIMIVDDETMILQTLKSLVSFMGYEVITCASGSEAINIYKLRHYNIKVSIIDLTLPDIMGNEIVSQFKDLNPNCKIIMMSGHGESTIHQSLGDQKVLAILSKPFDFDSLKHAINLALS